MWKSITVAEGLQQEQITAWYEKYRTEYSGLLNREESIQRRTSSDIPEDIWKDIVIPLLKPNHETTLLVGHPGTGMSAILPSIIQYSQQDHSDIQWLFWDVKPFDLTQSAGCFVRVLAETLQSGLFTDAKEAMRLDNTNS